MIAKNVRESMISAIGNTRPMYKNREGTTASVTNISTANAHRIAIGSGRKNLSDDALWLDEPIEEGYEIVSSSSTFSYALEEFWNILTVIKNTGVEKMTINETCVYCDPNNSNIRALPTMKSCMVMREVLDEPIVVSPGEKCVLSMNLVWPKD